MKLYRSYLFIAVVVLVMSTTGCVLEDFPDSTSVPDGGDVGSSNGSGVSCVIGDGTCDEVGTGASGSCIDGTCQFRCQSVFDDIDDDIRNGCEIDRKSVDTCGPSHETCKTNSTNRLPVCKKDADGVYGCGVSEDECIEGFVMDESEGCRPE